METRIQKWGNSLAVRLPREIIKETKLREGSWVSVAKKKNNIVIKNRTKRIPSLKELVGKIDEKNIHREEDWGNPYGKELW